VVGVSKQAHAQNHANRLIEEVHYKDILEAIARIRLSHPVMGLKKVFHKLKPISIGRDQFIALAQSANLGVQMPKNYQRTTFSTKSNRYKNLLNDLLLDDINKVWVSDITYFWVVDRFYYITLIMDIYSRKIVGYQAAASLVATANVAALNMAIKYRKTCDLQGLIHHSDKGTQYVFKEYTDILETLKAQISMCNIVYENSHSERINGIIKNEYLEHRNILNLEQLIRHLSKDIKLYNEDRPHWELNMMTPVEFENSLFKVPKNQRTKMKIYVDPQTIRKQKFANQLVLF
jgi:putative transposase